MELVLYEPAPRGTQVAGDPFLAQSELADAKGWLLFVCESAQGYLFPLWYYRSQVAWQGQVPAHAAVLLQEVVDP